MRGHRGCYILENFEKNEINRAKRDSVDFINSEVTIIYQGGGADQLHCFIHSVKATSS